MIISFVGPSVLKGLTSQGMSNFGKITKKEIMSKEIELSSLMLVTVQMFLGSGKDMRKQDTSEGRLFLVLG